MQDVGPAIMGLDSDLESGPPCGGTKCLARCFAKAAEHRARGLAGACLARARTDDDDRASPAPGQLVRKEHAERAVANNDHIGLLGSFVDRTTFLCHEGLRSTLVCCRAGHQRAVGIDPRETFISGSGLPDKAQPACGCRSTGHTEYCSSGLTTTVWSYLTSNMSSALFNIMLCAVLCGGRGYCALYG